MRIPEDIILIWPGTNASIPTNWVRETSLDSKFPKGWGVEDPDITGGADTHLHTMSVHNHTLTLHTHVATYLSTGVTGIEDENRQPGAGGEIAAQHGHTGTTGNNTVSVSGNSAVGNTGSVSNDPPNRKVIFIKASIGARLEANMVTLWNSNTAPANWSLVTEFQGRYLKGASTGADSDLITDNGSLTNIHDLTHGHTGGSHDHGNVIVVTNVYTYLNHVGNWSIIGLHNHTVATGSVAVSVNDFTSSVALSGTIEPVYTKLQAIKKGLLGVKEKGIIGLWLRDVADIPKGWLLMDGSNGTKNCRDKFVKIGDPSDTDGGSNTHGHDDYGHVHSSPPHYHSLPQIDHYDGGSGHGDVNSTNYQDGLRTDRHILHSATNTEVASPNWGSSNISFNVVSNQPSYRTAVYIQFQKEFNSGALVFSLLN